MAPPVILGCEPTRPGEQVPLRSYLTPTSPREPEGTDGFHRVTKEMGCLSVLGENRLYPPALWEMLESDNYEVALVPRVAWVHIRGSQVEPFSTAAPPVLYA